MWTLRVCNVGIEKLLTLWLMYGVDSVLFIEQSFMLVLFSWDYLKYISNDLYNSLSSFGAIEKITNHTVNREGAMYTPTI